MELKVHDKTGMMYRENTLDLFVIKERGTYYKCFEVCKDKVVMDIGGNIGMFSYFCLKNGAKQVIAYEPDESNFAVFCSQPMDDTRIIKNNVAVSNREGELEFFLNDGKNKGKHSVISSPHRKEKVIVPCVDFRKELDTYKPQILKIDIEGGEFFIDLENLPDYIEILAMELHNFHENFEPLLNSIKDRFEFLQESIDKSKAGKILTVTFVGKRK